MSGKVREILLDTETTGLGSEIGHRILEIGCVEIIDGNITGDKYHQYINPEREIDFCAEEVHGLTTEFLKDKPTFGQMVDDFMGFIGDSTLVAHNATFDIDFLNAEMRLLGREDIDESRTIIDTLVLARKCFPGQKNNLDALCDRLNVDYGHRGFHGALLDAELLAEVYIRLRKFHV